MTFVWKMIRICFELCHSWKHYRPKMSFLSSKRERQHCQCLKKYDRNLVQLGYSYSTVERVVETCDGADAAVEGIDIYMDSILHHQRLEAKL